MIPILQLKYFVLIESFMTWSALFKWLLSNINPIKLWWNVRVSVIPPSQWYNLIFNFIYISLSGNIYPVLVWFLTWVWPQVPRPPVQCKVNSGTCPHVIHINKQVTPAPVIGWTTSIFDHSIGWYITNWVEILFSLNKHSSEVTPHHITKC